MSLDDAASAARSPEGNLGYLFRVAYQSFRRQLEAELVRHGLTVPEYSALSAFDVCAQLSSAELARLLEVTPQTMNTLVHELLSRSLLERELRPTRGKTLLLRLTRRGRRLLDSATKTVRAVESSALNEREPSEQHIIKAWLSELARGVRTPVGLNVPGASGSPLAPGAESR
jgi:DNA-binding MarR family transcriptional regulator